MSGFLEGYEEERNGLLIELAVHEKGAELQFDDRRLRTGQKRARQRQEGTTQQLPFHSFSFMANPHRRVIAHILACSGLPEKRQSDRLRQEATLSLRESATD